MSATASVRTVLTVATLTVAAWTTTPLRAQSTTRDGFLAQSDESNILADCSLQVPGGFLSSNAERLSFQARPSRQDFTVFQLAGVGFTTAQADAQLNGASTLIQRDDTDAVVNDVSCCLEMRRVGGITTIGTSTLAGVVVSCGGTNVTIPAGVITNATQHDTVRCASGNNGGDIIIVNGLSECGGQTGNFGGCAGNNDAAVLVAGGPASDWAHEYGHVQNLDHSPLCNNNCALTAACTCATAGTSARNIMFCQSCTGVDTITNGECNSYRAGSTP